MPPVHVGQVGLGFNAFVNRFFIFAVLMNALRDSVFNGFPLRYSGDFIEFEERQQAVLFGGPYGIEKPFLNTPVVEMAIADVGFQLHFELTKQFIV
jgi:hypothetical protein